MIGFLVDNLHRGKNKSSKKIKDGLPIVWWPLCVTRTHPRVIIDHFFTLSAVPKATIVFLSMNFAIKLGMICTNLAKPLMLVRSCHILAMFTLLGSPACECIYKKKWTIHFMERKTYSKGQKQTRIITYFLVFKW